MLAEHGVAALACVSFKPALPPAGGVRPLYGTNPMAFAWPRPGRDPVVFDQASAVMARGEVMIAARDGHALPEGAGIGPDGQPTTDPNEVLKGAQLPFGGYKGSAIALMVDLLAGPLIGEVTSVEAGDADNGDGTAALGGELILAFDPARFGAEDPVGHGERLFERMLAMEGVRLPGDRRLIARAETPTTGIEIPQSLWDTLQGLRG